LLVAACAHAVPIPQGALPVAAVRQETDYSCGPAALLAILRYWQRGGAACEQDLYAPLQTSEKDGTEPIALERVARERGLEARYRTGVTIDELRRALAAGQTVIVDLQAWRERLVPWSKDWDDGHYVVLVAMDQRRAYVMDPSSDTGYSFLALDELDQRWHDFELRDGKSVRLQHAAVFIGGAAHAANAALAPAVKMR
jgi:predicted double-glycine peptidase